MTKTDSEEESHADHEVAEGEIHYRSFRIVIPKKKLKEVQTNFWGQGKNPDQRVSWYIHIYE